MKNSVMRMGNITVVGLKAISRNKLRSFLTMLGIVIGVGCVIAVVAIGNGATKSVEATINSLGTNFIMIFPGASTQSGAHIFTGNSSLTPEDADGIKAECPAVAYVSPMVRTAAQIVAGELNWGTSIQGVSTDYPLIRSWNVAQGDFFTDTDVKGAAKVCVLGMTVVDNLFPNGDAVGQIVRIKNVPFKVVGVLEKKGGNMMGQDQDDTIVVPYTTVMKRLAGKTKIDMIQVSAVSASQVQEAQTQIEAYLRQRHRIQPGQDSDFMMRSQEEIAQTQAASMGILRTLLLSIAAISLLVGGIGIMNIMLVSVTERTR
ncbi:MAG TPA: ABC transporter permease, partial [Thermoanaerobaculia bacterium]